MLRAYRRPKRYAVQKSGMLRSTMFPSNTTAWSRTDVLASSCRMVRMATDGPFNTGFKISVSKHCKKTSVASSQRKMGRPLSAAVFQWNRMSDVCSSSLSRRSPIFSPVEFQQARPKLVKGCIESPQEVSACDPMTFSGYLNKIFKKILFNLVQLVPKLNNIITE